MTTPNRKLKLIAEWVFDNEDTWNLKINGMSMAEIQMSKLFGVSFYAWVGQKVASCDYVIKSKPNIKSLEEAQDWVEQQLGATDVPSGTRNVESEGA